MQLDTNKIVDAVQRPKAVESAASAVQTSVLSAFESAGDTGKAVKNFLHGSWLGHPLHPIMTDIPIGAYTVTAVMDAMELCGSDKYRTAADASLAVGLAGAAGAAITGITDWTGTSGQSRRVGFVHGAINGAATLMNLASLILRRKQSTRNAGIALSVVGYAATTAAAYLGGHLVYGQKMGVDHTASLGAYPLEFTDIAKNDELTEGGMICKHTGDIPVLLARRNGRIHALVNTCSHLGGPLNEGEIVDDNCVKCPWHGSVFSLETGEVVDGPATEPQPLFETRVIGDMIQIRLHPKELVKRRETMDQG